MYKAFVSNLGLINLDLGFVLSFSCIVSINFYDNLLAATIAPIVIVVVLAGNYLVAVLRNTSSASEMREILRKHQASAIYLAIFVYSPVSNKIFQTFACDELDDGNSYLRADYSVSCLTHRHNRYKTYAKVMGCVYPFGTAALFALVLGRHRRDLIKPDRRNNSRLTPFRPLWASYKPSRYYYEVIECGRRVCLTGIAVLIAPNSTAQLSMVLLFAVVFVFISETLSPFRNAADTNLYRWGNGIIVASMYVAFLMKIDVAHDETEALLTFSGVLIAANAFMVVTILVQAVLLGKTWCRRNRVVREVDTPVRRRV